jgi:hypothetical protein
MSIFQVSRGITSSKSIFTKNKFQKCFSKYGLITLFFDILPVETAFLTIFINDFSEQKRKYERKIIISIFLGF